MIRAFTIVASSISLAGCMASGDTSSSPRPGATAMLSDAGGASIGMATITPTATGARVRADLAGLPAGVHGIHLHTTGRCDAPGFTTAGGHWNPTTRQHGRDNPQGAHHGDLPNVTIGANGKGSLDFEVPEATLAGMMDADGTALVVHAKADDYRTDPSGNSGDRIACGVISAS